MQWSSRAMLSWLTRNISVKEGGNMAEWKECLLGDLITFQRGHDLPKSKMSGNGYPVVGSNGIIGFHNEYTTEYPSITVGRSGNVGKPYIVYGRSWSHNTSLYIKEFKGTDPIFIYYFLQTLDLGNYAGGSAVPTLNRNHIHSLNVRVPADVSTQEKIANTLKALDDKIDKNTDINKNLLQQLHVLYLRLFCDSAMDTPLGDVVATTSGGTPSRKHDEYYSDSSICWVKSKELLGNYIHETEEHINDLAIKKSSAKLLPEHSVLIAMYGATVGAYGVISKPMTCNQAVCALLCNDNYPYTYLFQIAYESQQKFINLAVGSAQQNISQVLIKQLNLHSDLDIIQKFHDLALPMHQEIEFLQAENIRLSDLRDNLLPKLMSGELDVSNVEI